MIEQKNWRHVETGRFLEYQPIPATGLSRCPHGNTVLYADECDDCMREYE